MTMQLMEPQPPHLPELLCLIGKCSETTKLLSLIDLKYQLTYDPESGKFVSNLDTKTYKKGDQACHPMASGYLRVRAGGKRYLSHRLAWFYMTGEWPKKEIDHINHNKTDNRWCNLRDVSPKENQRNRPKQVNGCGGIAWNKRANKWKVYIGSGSQKTRLHLGYFSNKLDALAARKSAENKQGYHANHGR